MKHQLKQKIINIYDKYELFLDTKSRQKSRARYAIWIAETEHLCRKVVEGSLARDFFQIGYGRYILLLQTNK